MDIIAAAPRLYGIQIPIPSPLAHVNCYLARGRDGWTVVDTGFHTPEAEAAWAEALHRLGLAWSDIEKIIVTHYHPDHYGAAGWLQQRTGAPVWMHEPEWVTARRIWTADPAQAAAYEAALARFARAHGVPAGVIPALVAMRAETRRRALPAPRVTPFRAGTQIAVGDRTCQALCTPGHTGGLIVLWDEAERLLLANDMVLDPISPNISADLAGGGDPLGDYLVSLDRVSQLPARTVLTGHRNPIADLAARCAELKAHHHRRLEAAAALCDGRRTAWDVAQGLFAGRIDSPATALFAVRETVAHLDHLVNLGLLDRRRDEDGLFRYARR